MFREIRKKKNELSIPAAEALLQSCRRGVLAVNGDNGYPYAIPVNYFYDRDSQKIWFHGSPTGHKADALQACGKVCFTVYGNETVKAEAWAPFVQSVVVFGLCRPVTDHPRAMELLRKLAMKYYSCEALVEEEIARAGKAVRLLRSKWSTLAARKCRSGSFSHILPGSHSTEVAILRPGLPFPEHLRAYLSAKPDSSSKLSGSFPLIRLCSESRSFLPDLNFRLSTGRTGAASPKAGRQTA